MFVARGGSDRGNKQSQLATQRLLTLRAIVMMMIDRVRDGALNGKRTVHLNMGPLQLTVTRYRKHLAGEQATHWDIENKENSNPVRCFLYRVTVSCKGPIQMYRSLIIQSSIPDSIEYHHHHDRSPRQKTHEMRQVTIDHTHLLLISVLP